MKKAAYLLAIALFTSMFIFTSCGGGKDDNNNQDSTANDTVAETPEIFQYPIPTSFDMTDMLNEAGAAYIFNINDPENVDKYNTEASKALNLGVYGADLCYSSTYNMKQETMLYLEASKKLSDQLEINTPYSETFAERLETNIENTDSTYALISASIEDTYNYLKQNEKDDLSLLVMAGSIIEGMYIATSVAILTPDNEEITAIILEQKASLEEVVAMMEECTHEEVANIKGDLVTMSDLLTQAESGMTPEILNNLSDVAAEVRSKVVK
ncbi:MAG: hypothetical protein C0592_01325 [Marinilabiliales bacterium]|nr:MAG: hypothetical protein C0592_01325 [Marinilabiliales bacterium]